MCDQEPCTIACGGSNACDQSSVTCSRGQDCLVSCVGSGACNNGVTNCNGASSCRVTCIGMDSCVGSKLLGCSGNCTYRCVCATACTRHGRDGRALFLTFVHMRGALQLPGLRLVQGFAVPRERLQVNVNDDRGVSLARGQKTPPEISATRARASSVRC